MSKINVDQVLCSRAGWRLRFLIPFWAVQVSILLCLMGIFAYRLAETFEHYDEQDKKGEAPMVEVVWEATNVGFSTISLVLSILEIARMATEVLTPFLMLCTHIIKLTLALAILGLDVTVYLQRTDRHYSIVALALDCGLLVATIITFIYSLKTFRRLLTYEDYTITSSLKSGGHQLGHSHSGGNDLELGNSITISTSGGGKKRSSTFSTTDGNTGYPSQTAGLKTEIDRAIGAEFGWTESTKRKTGGVVVGSGVVVAHHHGDARVVGTSKDGDPTAGGDYYDDDGTETVRGGSQDITRQQHTRHGSIPTVVVSGHDDDDDDKDEDTKALLSERS